MTTNALQCVLFDLDGTLVDTAPDLIACMNIALRGFGVPSLAPRTAMPFISHGAMAMINHAAPDADDALKAQIMDVMLDTYQDNIAVNSSLFDGMAETLAAIEAQGLKWGVVTNKRQRFSVPLIEALQLDRRAICLVSGDSTAYPKPHPDSILLACQQAGVSPQQCVYVGDAPHDITAGKRAQVKTIAALYGYLTHSDQPEQWGADALITKPTDLLHWIEYEAATCH
jgi:phosphoglycolate phosphatase